MFTQTFDNFSARYQVDVVKDFQQVWETLCTYTQIRKCQKSSLCGFLIEYQESTRWSLLMWNHLEFTVVYYLRIQTPRTCLFTEVTLFRCRARKTRENCARKWKFQQDEGKVINSTVTMTESIQSEMKISSTSPQQHMSLPTRIQPSRSS